MGDVAQILQGNQGPKREASLDQNPSKAMRMTGMSKEVMHLLSGKQDTKSATLPPIIPTFTKDTALDSETTAAKVKVGNKWISSDKPARQWTWGPFASSARTDGAIFSHWVRANVEYTDYPYAKFDIHLDQVVYSDKEYATYLKSDRWTKSETDNLMELARRFELRWAIIHDRWFAYYHSNSSGSENPVSRSIDDLQQRYYSVAAILSQIRISQQAAAEVQSLNVALPDPTAADIKERTETLLLETAAAKALALSNIKNQPLIRNVGTGSTNKMYDSIHERERRSQLDRMWNRSKEEESEEIELRKELKIVEAQLRKLKKLGGHIIAASSGMATSTAQSRLNSAASSRNPSRSVSPVPGSSIAHSPGILNQSFASTAPMPMPQNPYLQSGRLVPPATGGAAGLNKTLLNKMDQTLAELKIPAKPVPTKRVCDLYDSVRKDVLALLTLKKMLLQKEGSLQSKRVKLSKLRGGDGLVRDEESLLGIAPPSTTAPSTTSSKGKGSKGGKSKASAGGSKSKSGAQSKGSTQSKAGANSRAGSQSKGGSQFKAGANRNNADDGKGDAKDSLKKPKTTAKRRRKTEPKAQASPMAPGVPSAHPGQTGATAAPSGLLTTPLATTKSTPSKVVTKSNLSTVDSKQAGAKKRARKS
jgi:DNA methyltransferase 1-associated protein 1